ncbi:MAG TPA: hypothetical protein VJB35_06785 [Candidatus Nanoarchaeia archaeon]|nr:hypothetical protein [Candidatus Nanoarchaeia archaeon]
MKEVKYSYNGLDETFVKIKNIILIGVIVVSLIIFFSFPNEKLLIKILEATITFLGILFGFFMINLVHWAELYDKLYNRNMEVLSNVIGKLENNHLTYASSTIELIEKIKNYPDNKELKSIKCSMDFLKDAHGWVKKSSLKLIITLVVFIISSLLFIYIEPVFSLYHKISIFSLLFILFLIIFQSILTISLFIHFPKIGQKLSD